MKMSYRLLRLARGQVSASLLLAALGACATPKSGADSTALLTTDTVKPAPAVVLAPDTTKTTSTSTKTKATKTKTKARTSAKTSTQQKTDSSLGRDSVIRFPKRPGSILPTVPPKKPPQ
jgi:hypothetical protein